MTQNQDGYQDCIAVPLGGNTTLYFGRAPMQNTETTEASGTKAAHFCTPPIQLGPATGNNTFAPPPILISIDGQNQQGVTQSQLVYEISARGDESHSYFDITSQAISADGLSISDIQYWCNVTIFGTPV